MKRWLQRLAQGIPPRTGDRPLTAVPVALLLAVVLMLLGQFWLQAQQAAPRASASTLHSAPATDSLQLMSLGEPTSLARLLMLHLQSVDFQSGSQTSYQALDYAKLEQWLSNLLDLDPRSQYPLMLASRIYAETGDPLKQRRMLAFIRQHFDQDPMHRWPWLAHAVIIAKHRLHDLKLASAYAEALESLAGAPGVPLWAWQMRVFILEDMDELQAARLLLGGILSQGKVHDPAELRFLEQRLTEIASRNEASHVGGKSRTESATRPLRH